MSVKICITITEDTEKKGVEIKRQVDGENPTGHEKKLAVHYLLALGRGLAHFGIEQSNSVLLDSAADFVASAEKIYREATPEERKA